MRQPPLGRSVRAVRTVGLDRRSTQLGRSVRTVGVCTDGRGRGAPRRVLVRRAPLSRVCGRFGDRVDGVALIGHRLPVPVGNAGLMTSAAPGRLGTVPRRMGAMLPRHRGSRNPHGVRRHRPACGHARADFTSPCTRQDELADGPWAHPPMVRARRVSTAVSNGRVLRCTWARRSPPWSVASRVTARSSGSRPGGSCPLA